MPVDDEPFQKVINIPLSPQGKFFAFYNFSLAGSEYNSGSQINHMSLKDIFLSKESLWKPIFGNYVAANKSPLFSIFRKKVENPNITEVNGKRTINFQEEISQFTSFS